MESNTAETELEYRSLWTESAAFNKEVFCRIQGGSGADKGKILMFFRTPSAMIAVNSLARVDDGLDHVLAFDRSGASASAFYLDDVEQATSSLTPGTDATVTKKAIGNWHPDIGFDEPATCFIEKVGIFYGGVLTSAQRAAWIADGTVPGGVTLALGFPAEAGTDGGTANAVTTCDMAET
jgi:hypothetical protein